MFHVGEKPMLLVVQAFEIAQGKRESTLTHEHETIIISTGLPDG
jgi:hypothetical protein